MVTFVIAANGLIGVVCLWIAWQLWQLRQKLGRIAETILYVEQVIHRSLDPAPNAILKAKGATHRLRQQHERLGIQLQKIEGFLVLLKLGEQLWQQRRIVSYGTKLVKRIPIKR